MRMALYSLLLVAAAGCGGSGFVPVSGKVTYSDGSPLTKGRVNFQSETSNAFGVIGTDGSYTLTSVEEGDGAPPGTYKVYITGAYEGGGDAHAPGGATNVAPPTPLVAKEFESAGSTPISVEVGGSTENYDIKVEKPK